MVVFLVYGEEIRADQSARSTNGRFNRDHALMRDLAPATDSR